MKRWPLRIILCLNLGAITTVAVAWGLFTGTSPRAQRVVVIPRATHGSMLRIDAASSGTQEEFNWDTSWCYLWESPSARGWLGPGSMILPPLDDVQIDLIKQAYEAVAANDAIAPDWIFSEGGEWYSRDRRVGWPVLALVLHERHEYGSTRLIESSTNGLTLESGLATRLKRGAIPVIPIWPGFVIDTLFYGAIWFGVVFAPGSAKRFIRIKRGRCPRCGYDLRGAPGLAAGCSECGWNREESAR